ncbi:hypothetical protein GCWU000325_01214 [Alloprevotella tannerae ATCC 51259]|uniref:Uncharacterized protein n=1 Tax=Alloprevotella tannerae ATCC 51259 TaxID=626522 RepID=C9LG73_9BACT|nr:hypothetical protein GCWU000325_01214 [Alloprevotella tannerae ATCC 51259]
MSVQICHSPCSYSFNTYFREPMLPSYFHLFMWLFSIHNDGLRIDNE